ncbi:MAG: DNA repair protein RecO [Fimbriimonadaceae bacterium]|nr:DNA repair protein RecO [Fimbriimonadaceae bacterium]
MSGEVSLTGLVLRRWDQGENDRRLSVLTREKGRILVTAKGARKSASRLASSSEPLALATFQIATGKVNSFITQAQPHAGFGKLRADYDRLILGLSYAELVSAVAPLEHPNADLFDSAVIALKTIETAENPLVASLWSQLKLMEVEGIAANWVVCAQSAGKLNEDPAWVSPTAGGYVSPANANDYLDCFLASSEVLIGLDRLSGLESPPPHMKHAAEALRLLARFWEHHAGRDLPATEAAMQALHASK